MLKPTLAVSLLCLSACGGEVHIPIIGNSAATDDDYRAAWGEPCRTSGTPDVSETWTYCVAQCPSGWCLGPCVPGCTEQTLTFINGKYAGMAGPYSTQLIP